MTTRAISIDGFPERPERTPAACGPAPQLDWIAIERLVVDHAYQREITRQGRRNVVAIATHFDWRYFSPVVVAPIAGGRFAIVDGQHRTTAAALVGHESVPCQIIMAAPGEQARAFSAINGATTRVHTLAMHKAAVAAGDPAAVAIEICAAEAGVVILANPLSEFAQEPGQTMAIGTLREALAAHGHNAVLLGLRAATGGRNAVRGNLPACIVRAVIELAAGWRAGGGGDDAFLDTIGRQLLIREAELAARERRPKQSVAAALAARLRPRLDMAQTSARIGA